jgi:anti-sigma regulatory factor (Ser/Thr protein kinase)
MGLHTASVCAVLTARVAHDLDQENVIVTPVGELTTGTRHVVRSAVRKALIECPRAVLVDLTAFADPSGQAPAMFLSLQQRAEREPPVPVFWCGSQGELGLRLARRPWRDLLRVAESLDRATSRVADIPPAPRRIYGEFRPDVLAASSARTLVGDACFAWGVPQLAHPARLVVSELVQNAVTHTGSTVAVTAVLTRRHLRLCVRDGGFTPPVLQDPSFGDPRAPLGATGTGLNLVDRCASRWGAIALNDGKFVWVVLER